MQSNIGKKFLEDKEDCEHTDQSDAGSNDTSWAESTARPGPWGKGRHLRSRTMSNWAMCCISVC